ncbi:MAG: CDP-alcohol phosphatidyltransferase family protein [Candidatus Binataceae bacterium]
MLDSWLAGSSRLRGAQSRAASVLYHAGLRANYVTAAGGLLGTVSGLAFARGYNAAALAALWISASLDAVDGTVARNFEHPTPIGGVLDLSLDRVVEAMVLLGIAWRRPFLDFAALTVLASWYVNITVFLAVGAAVGAGTKLIHYPPGLLERTEALVFFTLLVFSGSMGIYLCYIYAAAEILTALQRLRFARRELR